MSKFKKTLIIVLVVIGILSLIFGILFLKMNFDPAHKTFKTVYTEKDYDLPEGDKLQLIFIKVSLNDIQVKVSPDNQIHLRYYEDNFGKYELFDDIEDGVLQLNYTLEKSTQSKMDFLKVDRDTTLYLSIPSDYKGAINVSTTDGNVTASGLKLITLLSMTSVNGSITADDIITVSKFGAISSVGDINCTDIMCGNAYIKSENGTTQLDKFEVADKLQMESVDGNVKALNLTAEYFDLKTVSGTMDAYVLGKSDDYFMKTTPNKGTINVPEGTRRAKGTLKTETETGTINVVFSEQ
ncbi:MAG: DUF4097 domain-containing protein [Clostridiales bacterium]|nr:DUF4097 domain-containing protein [Clostridiales bacterium]